jgi:hypothetical protein
MKGIRRHLGALAAALVSLHTLTVTAGVASCCLAASSHHADMPEFCPMVHAEGETCPMHAEEPASHDAAAGGSSDECRIGCGPTSSHALLQAASGGPLAAPAAFLTGVVSTTLPLDTPPHTLDPGARPFAPPPRG